MKNVANKLKLRGARMTKTREPLLKLLKRHGLPLTEAAIRARLAGQGIAVNKTTVYRELEYLKSQNIIKEINFGDGKKRYELNSGHHHHLVCINCDCIDDIKIQGDVKQIERQIATQKQFKIFNHSLEFFGLCKVCSKKGA
jgi:Fe2+ or Zn2+ uptake regulation protein